MFKLLPALALAPLLCGCAVGLEHVDIAYKSATIARPIAGAGQVVVQVSVNTTDASGDERVGVKKNGYGIEMGGLAATRPVAAIVGDAFASELIRRGFSIGPSRVQANIDVPRFMNDFKGGFFVVSTEADVTLTVTVGSGDGMFNYAKSVTGRGERTMGMALPAYAREALEDALTRAVAQIVADPAFIRALFAANGTPPAS